MREQRRHHVRVPVVSGRMERRPPAAEQERGGTRTRRPGFRMIRLGQDRTRIRIGNYLVSVREAAWSRARRRRRELVGITKYAYHWVYI